MVKFIDFPKTAKFYKPVTRKESLLVFGFMSNFLTTEKEHEKILGIKHAFNNVIYLNGEVYYDSTEVEDFKKKILKIANKDENILFKLAEKCEKESNKIMNFTEKIRKSDFKKLNYNELIELFEKYFRMMIYYIPFLMLPLTVERIYDEKIKNVLKKKVKEDKIEEYLVKLIFPKKPNRDYYEHISFFNIATEYNKKGKIDKSIKEKIKKHLDKFSRFGQRFGFGEIWNENDIIQRIKAYQDKHPDKEKESMIFQRKQNQILTKKILNEIKASKKIEKMVNLIKEYVYLRTLRTEVISLSFANMNPLFKEIGERNNLTFEHINYSTYWEVSDRNFQSKSVINQRKNGFAFIHNKDDYLVLLGDEVEKARIFYGFQEKKKNLILIKGQAANQGVVVGEAKIVMNNSQLKKVKKNDILIAPMTTPDFVPAMEKAAAFITDEGGILCHAAIVGREMNKPCIIGTKIATQVLKDGDLVEVDANKGVVKIIKKRAEQQG